MDRHHVEVDGSGLYISMPEELLNSGKWRPLFEQGSGEVMPQGMGGYTKARCPSVTLNDVVYVLGPDWEYGSCRADVFALNIQEKRLLQVLG